MLILSFFFAGKIERLLGLKYNYYTNQVAEKDSFGSDYFVSYLDVGQGNCTVAKLPDGKILVIDGGSSENSANISNKLNSLGITSIDYMIATHADEDHIGGLIGVLDNFEVKNIFRPFQICGVGTNYENFIVDTNEDLEAVYNKLVLMYGRNAKVSRVTSEKYSEFLERIYKEKYNDNSEILSASVTVFYDGLKIEGDRYKLEFFMPLVRSDNIDLLEYSNTNGFATVGYGANDSNGNSAMFLLTIENEKFMFTGDAPFTDSEGSNADFEELDFVNSLTIEESNLLSNVSVYLVGHHGSKYSSSYNLLNIIKPLYSVVSVDENNSYGFPRYEVIERLDNVKRTSDYLLETSKFGDITFAVTNNTLVYSFGKEDRKEKVIISWYVLGSVIFIFISYAIISLKIESYATKKELRKKRRYERHKKEKIKKILKENKKQRKIINDKFKKNYK